MEKQMRPRLPEGFADDVRQSLSELKVASTRLEDGQRATNEHLRTLNGRTAKSEDRIVVLEKAFAVEEARKQGEEAANKRWFGVVKPFIPWMVGPLLGAAAVHFSR